MLDKRNLTLRALRGVGTIAAGLLGVTTFGSSYAPSVAAFNGPVITAFTSTFPDLTINQLTRLNDSAYLTNTIVPRQQAKVLVVFLPQAIFLDKGERKAFWKDPAKFFKDKPQVDLRKLEVAVDGSFIAELEELPPVITQAFIEESECAKFQSNKPEVKGYIFGHFLTGAKVGLVSTEPTGLSISLGGTPDDKRLDFILKSDKPVPQGTPITIKVWKEEEFQTTTISATCAPRIPRIESVEISSEEEKKLAVAGSTVTGSLKGSNLDVGELSIGGGPGDLTIERRGDGSSTTQLNFVIHVKTAVPPETTLTFELKTVNNISSKREIRTPKSQ